MKKIQKTNAMRFLDQYKVEYEAHTYEHKDGDPVDGVHVANMLHQPVEAVYKTLVTQANTKEYLVYMLPVEKELDLKKCAKIAGVKSCEMIHVKDINKITGYIRGGCSPLGMKKQFRTFIEKDCLNQDKIYFSAGKIGMQIEMDPKTLMDLIHVQAGDITKE
ncbi:Cys-tRNA(Pro) deacylase [Holdemanella porci]|uniref:Cys-tRNA(Pro) deacylase n=1 Tax=Holdemanella porci TaxID=2652276 RepID=UPI003AEF99E1